MSQTFTRNSLVVAALVLCAAAVAGFWSRDTAADQSTPAAATAKPALTVTAVRPQAGRLPVRLTANGSIAAWQEASVGTEANGLRLAELRAGIGDVVRAGQVLATFADASVQADLALARANLLEAQANALDAAGNAQRARTLKETGALSTQQINQYLTLELTAQARVAAAKAALDVQQLRLKHTQVVAPDHGVISARSATIGSVVPAGTELFRMIRKGRLEWRAEVTASELGRIGPGTAVLVTAASGTQVRGKVRMVGPTVDAQTRTALVYVDLPANQLGKGRFSAGPPQGSRSAAKPESAPKGLSPAAPGMPAQTGAGRRDTDPGGGTSSVMREATRPGTGPDTGLARTGAMLPGMFATGAFELGDSGALLVPQSALVMRDGFSYVYRLGDDRRVARVKVSTGRQSGELIEITSALDANALLVASGAGFLNEGDLVRVVDNPQAAATPAKPAAAASR